MAHWEQGRDLAVIGWRRRVGRLAARYRRRVRLYDVLLNGKRLEQPRYGA